jgi:hypothetical protein
MFLPGASFARLRRRALIAIYIGLAAGFALAFVRILTVPGAVMATDFTVFWTAWSLILHGPASVLYSATAQLATQQVLLGGDHFEGGLMAFVNPPHVALAGVPLGWLADHAGERAAFVAWTAVNLALLATLDRYLRNEWDATPRDRWVLSSALVAFYPVFCAFGNAQTSILLALAVLGLYRAVEQSRALAAAGWLVVISIKPQLLPMLVIYLIARRCWRAIAWSAIMFAAVAVLTAAVLGPSIWFQYLVQLPHLERFWGTGTPEYMLNVRGILTRIMGTGAQDSIDAIAYAVWVSAMLLVAILLVHRRVERTHDARSAYAFVVAVGLLSNPHLFIQDAVIWTVPLVLHTAALRDGSRDWRLFAQFALAWPVVFAVTHFLEVWSGHATIWLDPEMLVLIAGTVTIARGWLSAGQQEYALN